MHRFYHTSYTPEGEEPRDVTVCIAALCAEGYAVVCAADRMLTGGNTQFEHDESKIKRLTPSMFILTAGTANSQSEIVQIVQREAMKRVTAKPNEWLLVSDVAQLYADSYNQVWRRVAAQRVLEPLGLNYDTFLARQKELDPDFVKAIATELSNLGGLDTETIIAGCDATGAHIFVAYDGQIQCCNDVGFAAVGSGGGHARSHLMQEAHARKADISDTVFRVFFAKRRAEVAPGVGEDTDLWVVGPAVGNSFVVATEIQEKLAATYTETRKKERKLAETATQEIKSYVGKRAEAIKEQGSEPIEPGAKGGGEASVQ